MLTAVISIGATVLGLLVVCYPLLFSGLNGRESLCYSVVVECGSTMSRIQVYGFDNESGKPVSEFEVATYYNHKLHRGLWAYANDLNGASVSLTKLVELAKERIPKRMWMETEVRLIIMGTGLLDKPVQKKFLKVARKVLKSSGFMFREEWASVISGSEDVVNAWVVTMLALGSLGGDPLNIIRGFGEVIEASWKTEKVFVQIQADAYVLVFIMFMILVVIISLKI